MYKSPIEIIDSFTNDMAYKIKTETDNLIMEAVYNVGVNVDKAELIKALEYDRDQYEKGYRDGKKDAVNHAYWNKRGDEWAFPYDCSNCGHGSNKRYPFCRLCGAKMDAEEDTH